MKGVQIVRRTLTSLAGAATAVALAIPVANAAKTKFEFEDVTFPDGQTGTIYASVKDMKSKTTTSTASIRAVSTSTSATTWSSWKAHRPTPTPSFSSAWTTTNGARSEPAHAAGRTTGTVWK